MPMIDIAQGGGRAVMAKHSVIAWRHVGGSRSAVVPRPRQSLAGICSKICSIVYRPGNMGIDGSPEKPMAKRYGQFCPSQGRRDLLRAVDAAHRARPHVRRLALFRVATGRTACLSNTALKPA